MNIDTNRTTDKYTKNRIDVWIAIAISLRIAIPARMLDILVAILLLVLVSSTWKLIAEPMLIIIRIRTLIQLKSTISVDSCIRNYMVVYCCICLYVNVYGCIRQYMALSGCTWDQYGCILCSMVSCALIVFQLL